MRPNKSPLFSWSSRSIFIRTEATPNEHALKFLPGQTVLSSATTVEFKSRQEALRSPLATSLFDIQGIESMLFGSDFIAINKSSTAKWKLLKPEIYAAIMDFFTSGQPVLRQQDKMTDANKKAHEPTSEIEELIVELLDSRIRPSIQADGGDVEYRGLTEDGHYVKLLLKGACRSCSSSTVTLKNGIENMILHYVPEVKGVIQVSDETEKISEKEFAKLEEKLKHHDK